VTAAVVLTGARAPATLDLARRFAEAGHRVVVADSEPTAMARSRAVHKAYRVPSARFAPRAFARAVAQIADRHGAELVVPTCEEIFWLTAVADEAAGSEASPLGRLRDILFAPPSSTLRRLHDKAEFGEMLLGLGIAHPPTQVVESAVAWRHLARSREHAASAVVVKPAFSRFGTRTQQVAPDAPLPEVGRVTRAERWLVQERVEGQEFCTFAVALDGTLTAFVAYRPVWRAGSGAGVAFDRLGPDSREATAARAICDRIARTTGFTGQFGLDLMQTGADVIVLECNPRATSGIHLFAPADALPSAYLRAATSRSTGESAGCDAGRAVVEASRDWARLALPHAMYALAGIRSPRDLVRFARQLDAPDALRPPGDRIPLGALVRSVAVRAAVARCSGRDLLGGSTFDLEWNGEPLPPRATAPGVPGRGWADAFVGELNRIGVSDAVENIDADLTTLATARVGVHEVPITISRPSAGAAARQSYVVSPVSHYVHYAREELGELRSPLVRRLASAVLTGLGAVLTRGRADDIVIVGNALVSTNLLPELQVADIRRLTRALVSRHPHAVVAWRSVHGRGSSTPEALKRAGYQLIPSRSVLFTSTRGTDWMRARDTARDRRLLETSGYQAVAAPIDPDTGRSDAATRSRIAELYRMLYLEKYSGLNPAYTAEFIGAAQASGMLRFVVLVRDDRIDGVFGYSTGNGLLAAPVLGYDTGLPPGLGLYRMLSYLIARTAHENDADLHGSSGVADFKRNRGAENELEYTAVYTRHLPLGRRLAWRLLRGVVDAIAVPLLRRTGF